MVVGVRIGNAVDGVQEPEFPEHAQERTKGDAGIAVLDAVQGAPANAAGLGQVLCAQVAADARNAHALAKLIKML